MILEFSHIVIQDENHLIHLVSLTPIGKQIDLLVLRNGKKITIPVLLGDRTELQLRSQTPAVPDPRDDEIKLMQQIKPIGLTLKRLNASLAGQLGLEDQTDGLLVLRINSVNPSDDELQLYDIIVEAARKPVHTLDDLNSVLDSLPANDPVYSISKMALVALTKSLALCHGKDRIRVNCVCPGPVGDTGRHIASHGVVPADKRNTATCV